MSEKVKYCMETNNYFKIWNEKMHQMAHIQNGITIT